MKGLRIHFYAILMSLCGATLAYVLMGRVLDAEKGDAFFYVLWTGLTLAGIFLLSFVGMFLGMRFLGKYRANLPKGWWKWMLLALACLFAVGCIGQWLYSGREKNTQTVQNNADVVLLIDASGSMDGSTMLAAKDAACQFVDILNSKTRLQLISFAGCVLDDMGLVTMDSAGKASAKTFISNIDSTGATDFDAPLQCAIDSLNTNGRADAKPMVILMTDGQDLVSSSVQNQYFSSGVPVYTVQITAYSGDRDLIRFSQQSGGFDTQIDPAAVDASQLLDGFRKALDDTVSVSYGEEKLLLTDDPSGSDYRWILRWVVMSLCYVICAVGFYGKPGKWGLVIRALAGAGLGVIFTMVGDYHTVVPLYILLIGTAYVLVRPCAEVEIDV